MVGVRSWSCSINISQLINVVENSINLGVHIKSHLFDHILTLGKHIRCGFSIGIDDMLEDDADGILDGVIISITKISVVLCANSCDDFMP